MHRTERWEEIQAGIDAAMDRLQSRMWTKLPCKITSVQDLGNKQIVTVQPTVQLRVKKTVNGQDTWQNMDWPALPMVPVKFPSGGGFTMTFPIAVGNEGTVSFASRAIDNWWQNGGSQPPLASNGVGSLRQHDPSDGFFEMGGRSLPNALSNVSTNSCQLRSDDGHNYMDFSSSGFKWVVNGHTMTFDTSGNLTVDGNVIAGHSGGSGSQVDLLHHTHSNAGGTGDSGPPNPGS